MNVYEIAEIRNRLQSSFPKAYVNMQFEIIIYPPRNSYFRLSSVETEEELNAKILEWLSREASKSLSRASQKYHLDGINKFLGTSFTQDDMIKIYTYLGNAINHDLTIEFIRGGYDLKVIDAAVAARGAAYELGNLYAGN